MKVFPATLTVAAMTDESTLDWVPLDKTAMKWAIKCSQCGKIENELDLRDLPPDESPAGPTAEMMMLLAKMKHKGCHRKWPQIPLFPT